MRIAEMREREDFGGVLAKTLEQAWSRTTGTPTTVTLEARGVGQRWAVQPLLSAYYTHRLGLPGRRFLRDSFRISPSLVRLGPQFILGTALATRTGLALTSSHGFRVTPAIAGDEDKVVMPGNRRLRIFDFARGECLVVTKAGFDTQAMAREIAARSGGPGGPFAPIAAHATDQSWFTEAILEGYALPRCPPWFDREGLARLAKSRLAAWSRQSSERVDAGAYAASLAKAIRVALVEVGAGAAVERSLGALVESARTLGELAVANTHGDFQPGNIMVTAGGMDVTIIDWEHAARRASFYDAVVFDARARAGAGLAARLLATMARSNGPLPEPRRAALAMFALEDLRFVMEESQLFRRLSAGACAWIEALPALVPALRAEGRAGGSATSAVP